MHGGKPPQTEGHRNFDPQAKEADQPTVLGYCDNFRLATLPDGTKAIVCDQHTQAQYIERAKNLPYVSVEYQSDKKRIIGVARLKRPPYLNLGGTFYPDGKQSVFIYSMVGKMDDQKPTDQPAPDTEELTPEETAAAEKVYRYMCRKYAWMGDAAKKYEAMASATNTAPPEHKEPDGDEPEEYKALRLKVAKLEAERERDKVAKLVDTLRVEGYQFDANAEEARLLALDDAGRTRRVDEVRKFHQRTKQAGTAAPVQVYQGSVTPSGGKEDTVSQETVAKALQYMKANEGVEFYQALAAVTKK